MKSKSLTKILMSFALIICTVAAFGAATLAYNAGATVAKADEEETSNLSATKIAVSAGNDYMLLVTAIKDVADVYEVGYVFDDELADKTEHESRETTKYYSAITLGETVYTAETLFGEDYEGAKLIIWEIAYTRANAYTFKAYYIEGTRINDVLYAKKTDEPVYGTERTKDIPEYTITWKNGDEIIKTDTVKYGETPVYEGDDPEKAADAQYTYTFDGWSPEVSSVTGDATYTATYSTTTNEYTVTWVNEGVTIETDLNVPYGTTPSFDGATPEKAATAQYTYTFSGWSPTVTSVTGDATYTATFSQTVNNYTVSFDENGANTSAPSSQTVAYGSAATEPSDPVRYGYHFDGWYNGDDAYNFNAAIHGDVALTAHWSVYYYDTDFSSASTTAPSGVKITAEMLNLGSGDSADCLATDGGNSVFKFSTNLDMNNNTGATLTIEDYDLSTPVAKLRVKTSSSSENRIGFEANGVQEIFRGFESYEYVYLNLGNTAGTKTITISRKGATVIVCIDSIEFVSYSEVYGFANGDETPIGASWRNTAGTVSIVSDTGTTDGYALKATHSAGTNFIFNIADIGVSEYAHVIMRVKIDSANLYVYIKNATTNLSLNSNGLSANGSYVDIDVSAVAAAKGWTDILAIETWSNGVSSTLYIDSITTYATDLEYLNARNNYNNGYNPSLSGGTKTIVADADATDGYAVQIQTGTTNWQHCYLSLIGSGYSYSDHYAIKIRLKMTGATGAVYPLNGSTSVNSSNSGLTISSTYYDYYIFPNANCNRIDFSNTGTKTNITFTIDYIEFIPVGEEYGFYGYASDTVRTSPNGTIVADANAADGYALKIVKNSGNNAYYYLGRTYTIADYEHIYVRIRFDGSAMNGVYVRNATTPNNSAGSGVNVTSSISTSGYTTIDLVQLLTTIDAFNQIDIWDAGSHTLYIDSIEFVPKA